MQDNMDLLHRGRGESVVKPVAVEVLHMRWREGFELEPAQRGFDVEPEYLLVALVGALPHRVLDRIGEPAVKVISHTQAAGIEDEPAIPIRYRLGELGRRCGPRPALDGPALRSFDSAHRVARAIHRPSLRFVIDLSPLPRFLLTILHLPCQPVG